MIDKTIYSQIWSYPVLVDIGVRLISKIILLKFIHRKYLNQRTWLFAVN